MWMLHAVSSQFHAGKKFHSSLPVFVKKKRKKEEDIFVIITEMHVIHILLQTAGTLCLHFI